MCVVTFVTASTAGAQQQTKAQQLCINALNGATRGVVAGQGKTNAVCLRYVDRAPLDSCIAADPRGFTEKATLKLASVVASRCDVVPDFGFTSAATANASAIANSIALFHDVFGTDLSFAALNGSNDPDVAGCQRRVHKAYEDLFRAHVEAFDRCKRERLMSGLADSPVALALCLKVMTVIASPPIEKKYAKLARSFTHCPRFFPEQSFPGRCQGSGRDGCMLHAAFCRACLLLDEVDDLRVSCDVVDDGHVNGSCFCGDGVPDRGEECDDGNLNDGDGCSSLCRLE